jgi:hypothetical protein
MYVAPRPDPADDPLYAVRLAALAVAAFAAVPFVQPSMPSLFVALPIGLMAGMRKAFDPAKALGGPLALVAMTWLLGEVVEAVRVMPAVLLIVMGLVYFAGFYVVQRTGNPAGMLVVVAGVLMSIIGMSSTAALDTLQDSFLEAGVFSALAIPILHAVIPVRTQARMVEHHEPAKGSHVRGALIRAIVQLLLSLWLYAVVDVSNMILAVAATMVLVFPCRTTLFAEAGERVLATVYGALAATVLLGLFTLAAHFEVLLILVFLQGLTFGSLMMWGRKRSMVYQFSLSVALALVAGALSTQEPSYAALTRVVLTFAGTLVAALLTALLEALFNRQGTIGGAAPMPAPVSTPLPADGRLEA